MSKMNRDKKRWTLEEDDYLQLRWGNAKVRSIAKRLGRSIRSVEHRAVNLGLGGMYRAGECWMASDVARILGVHRSTVCTWIKKNGLIAKKVCYKSQAKYKIEISDLINWLENNQNKWSAKNVEEYALGIEPEWLKNKRKKDSQQVTKRKRYTPEEDNKIITMYKLNYTIEEIAKETGRTRNMIASRVRRLRSSGKYKIPYKNAKNQIKNKAV